MIKLMISFVCEFDANILDISDKKSLYAPFTIHDFFFFSIFFSFFFCYVFTFVYAHFDQLKLKGG